MAFRGNVSPATTTRKIPAFLALIFAEVLLLGLISHYLHLLADYLMTVKASKLLCLVRDSGLCDCHCNLDSSPGHTCLCEQSISMLTRGNSGDTGDADAAEQGASKCQRARSPASHHKRAVSVNAKRSPARRPATQAAADASTSRRAEPRLRFPQFCSQANTNQLPGHVLRLDTHL